MERRSSTVAKRRAKKVVQNHVASKSAAAPIKRSYEEMIQGDGGTGKASLKLPTIDDNETKKMPAEIVPTIDEKKAWEATLKHIPRCCAADDIRQTSIFCNQPLQGGGSGRNTCLRKILHEIGSLQENLPSNPAIFIRFDCETPQFLRALITGPTGTPYAFGLFCFDIYIPDSYPNAPPKFHLLTTGNGSVRFSPNLYADGKVCLSLLNTWSGPKWSSNSTLLQVLVSIQGLILGVEHPYYLEPGHGGWEGQVKSNGGGGGKHPPHVKRHEDKIRIGTVKFALSETIKEEGGGAPRFLKPFRQVIDAHFYHHKDAIIQVTNNWKLTMGSDIVHGREMTKAITNLQSALNQLKKPPQEDDASHHVSTSSASASTNAEAKASKETPENEEKPTTLVVANKRLEMEKAAAKQDFVTAGRIQSEIQHLESDGVEAKIVMKRQEMEQAAKKQDYITAGELQREVQHLERQKHLLQDLECRMFAAAAKFDFVRAGRFQEQYQILLNPAADDKTSASAAMSGTAPSSSMHHHYSNLYGPNAQMPPLPPPSSYPAGFYDDGYDDDVYDDEDFPYPQA